MSPRRAATRWSALLLVGLAVGLLGASPQAKKHATAPEVDLSTMIAFEAGSFVMGVEDLPVGPYGDWWFVDQQPAHEVQLGAFHLDRHEVTVSDFALFLTHAAGEFHFHPDQPIERVASGYLPRADQGQRPIHYVSWQAAQHYCLWAGKRLPTEAEWERAAAGVEGRAFPWGDEGSNCTRATHFTGSSYCQATALEVQQRPEGVSPDGVHDLAGNVAEWTADFYDAYPAEPQQDPSGPALGSRAADPSARSANIGFRCALGQAVEDGALRGAVDNAPDNSREPSDRPLAASSEEPEVVATDLLDPVAIVSLQGTHYVLARGAAAIVAVSEPAPGQVTTKVLVEGLDQPTDLASDQSALFVTEATTVRRFTSDGEATTLATGQTAPTHIVAADGQAVWAASDGIHRPRCKSRAARGDHWGNGSGPLRQLRLLL